MRKRKKTTYFDRVPGAPDPVVVEMKRRVRFNEADPMAIVWHGRYPLFFEEASEELGRLCGMSYKDFFEAGVRAPIVELHIDYFQPLFLDEEFTIRASLIWHEGSRMNTEFQLIKQNGSLATSGYMVQLFSDHRTGEAYMVSPELLERCRQRWKAGEFYRKP
ncbi:MAG TPA: acyl-CoA thioesterase [Nitrospirota bacterium]|nr:acyl-CoA thioesterase [Nitrospirota bacterium]